MTANRSGFGTRLAGLSGLALILIMFIFAWYGVDGGGQSVGLDAFDAYDDWVGLLLVLAATSGIALALVGAAATREDLPMALSAITAAVGIVAAIVVLIYLISPPGFPTFGTDSGFDVDLSRKLGVYLGLIATLGIAAGGWMAMQEEATAFGAGADRAGTGGGPPPPPPSGGPPPASGGPAA